MDQPQNPMTLHATWDLVAADYQTDVQPQFAAFATRALELAGVRAGSRVVDVACGPGTLAFAATKLGARVAALDFSPSMIRCLEERARLEPCNVEAVVGDGMDLPWPDSSFDAAFSMFGLMFFPDRGRGFRELCRVLKPGARAVVSSWVPMTRVPIMADIYGTMAKLVPGLPFGETKSPLSSPEECDSEMREGGFREVEVHECEFGVSVPSVAAFWVSLQRSTPPVRLAAEKIGPERWRAIAKEVADSVTATWGTGPQTVPMVAYLSVGTR